MASLRESAVRLMRTVWRKPQQLAEELFAILSQDLAFDTSRPTTLDQQGTEPVLTIRVPNGVDPSTPVISIQRGDNTVTITPQGINVNDVPFSSGGGFPTGFTYPNAGGQAEEPRPSDSLPPFAVMGKIRSGSGNTYTVAVYETNPGSSTALANGTVTAKVLQIASDAVIPADTWVYLVGYPRNLAGSVITDFVFQPPVWLRQTS